MKRNVVMVVLIALVVVGLSTIFVTGPKPFGEALVEFLDGEAVDARRDMAGVDNKVRSRLGPQLRLKKQTNEP